MPHIPSLFVTATSTGAGKTVVAVALLRLLGRMGVRAVGLKPVASGSEPSGPSGALRNADALELQAAAPVALAYDEVNPWCFAPAIAPHIAAAEAGRAVTLEAMADWYERVTAGAGFAVVEGAGGWRVPLHPEGFLSDFPESRGMDVVLVVGMTLGCLNHARLTAEAIERGGRCRLAGWIANAIDPGFERREQNLDTLVRLLGSEPLAAIPALPATGESPPAGPVADLSGAARLAALLRRLAGPGGRLT